MTQMPVICFYRFCECSKRIFNIMYLLNSTQWFYFRKRRQTGNRAATASTSTASTSSTSRRSTATRRYGKLCNLCKNNMTKIYTDVTNVNVAKTIVRCGYHRQDKCVKQSGVSKKYIFYKCSDFSVKCVF